MNSNKNFKIYVEEGIRIYNYDNYWQTNMISDKNYEAAVVVTIARVESLLKTLECIRDEKYSDGKPVTIVPENVLTTIRNITTELNSLVEDYYI